MPYISVINEGEISYYTGNNWVGSLENLNNEGGFWIILSDITLLTIEGNYFAPPMYFLNSGANLISYLGGDNELIIDALSDYNDNFTAIIEFLVTPFCFFLSKF